MDFSLPESVTGALNSAGKAVSSAAGAAYGAISGGAMGAVSGAAAGLVNPSMLRMAASGLLPGAINSLLGGSQPSILGVGLGLTGAVDDWRVKISLGAQAQMLYRQPTSGDGGFFDTIVNGVFNAVDAGVMRPLIETDGVVFPYTPSITTTHTARYQSQQLTHSNYTHYNYEGSEVGAITVSGEFTAQNYAEAKYVLASIVFFRACTKMFFGTGPYVGNPPPIVFLSGYGESYLPRVSCVVTNFSHTMPPDVDYIVDNPYLPPGMQNWVPTTSTLSVTLQPVVSRAKVASGFNLQNYARGKYLGGEYGGGFL